MSLRRAHGGSYAQQRPWVRQWSGKGRLGTGRSSRSSLLRMLIGSFRPTFLRWQNNGDWVTRRDGSHLRPRGRIDSTVRTIQTSQSLSVVSGFAPSGDRFVTIIWDLGLWRLVDRLISDSPVKSSSCIRIPNGVHKSVQTHSPGQTLAGASLQHMTSTSTNSTSRPLRSFPGGKATSTSLSTRLLRKPALPPAASS